jgi:hypothetical protein
MHLHAGGVQLRFRAGLDAGEESARACAKRRGGVDAYGGYGDGMSKRHGDRARFQKNRKRKLRHRERIHALAATLPKHAYDDVTSRAASQGMLDERVSCEPGIDADSWHDLGRNGVTGTPTADVSGHQCVRSASWPERR